METEARESQTARPGRGGPRQQLVRTMRVTERTLALGGIRTAVLEGGEGPPLVLLHGPAAHAAHWLRIVPGLVTTHRVIAPDLPGHGASLVTEGAPDAPRVLDWLRRLVESTCDSPPVLVGHLVGGAIAARFAVESSDRLRRLVLVDPLGLDVLRMPPEFAEALHRFLADPNRSTHEGLWRHCTHDLDGLRDAMGELWAPFEAENVDRARAPHAPSAVSALMEHFGTPPIPASDLGRIAVPTSLICGRHDRVTLPAAEATSLRFGWALHVIEGAGDDPPVEQPEALLRALRAVLSDAADDSSLRVGSRS